MRSLIKKELRIQFASPVATVVATLFLFLVGFAFTAGITQMTPSHLPEASLRGLVYFMAVILLFFCPLLTMRSFAEERRQGTMELLKTAPITDRQIVLGKYLGVLLLLGLILGLTIELPLLLLLVGRPDPAPILLSYVGLILLAASNCAVGLLASAMTKNQVVAALLSFVFLLTLWFVPDLLGPIGEAISPISHITTFSEGVLSATDLLYYLLFIGMFLLATVKVLEAER